MPECGERGGDWEGRSAEGGRGRPRRTAPGRAPPRRSPPRTLAPRERARARRGPEPSRALSAHARTPAEAPGPRAWSGPRAARGASGLLRSEFQLHPSARLRARARAHAQAQAFSRTGKASRAGAGDFVGSATPPPARGRYRPLKGALEEGTGPITEHLHKTGGLVIMYPKQLSGAPKCKEMGKECLQIQNLFLSLCFPNHGV